MIRCLVCALALSLCACSWLSGPRDAPPERTLADLGPGKAPDTEVELPQVELEQLTQSYREALRQNLNPEVRVEVMHRLADLELLRGEQRLFEQNEAEAAQTGTAVFNEAIATYEELLAQQDGQPGGDRILYQLSKAYDLSGQADKSLALLARLVRDYPRSEHFVEAQFRRAEHAFAQAEYAEAKTLYAEVAERGRFSEHYRNALYMLGWSEFKLDRFEAALEPFSRALDDLLPGRTQPSQLVRGEQELMADTLRIMSLVLSYLEGPQSIAELFEGFGARHYEGLLYDRLGELYLSQERYRDSAEVYRAYLALHPDADQAPDLYGKLISVFEEGDFAIDVRAEKANYVRLYHPDSDYWRQRFYAEQDRVTPHLQAYIEELARHYHALAQQLKAGELDDQNLAALNADEAAALRLQLEDRNARERALQQLAKHYFARAAGYYQQYIETFAEAAASKDMAFLMAEAWFEAENYEAAIPAYELVAYGDARVFASEPIADPVKAAAAGYAIVLAHEHQLQKFGQGVEAATWQAAKIEAQLRFAEQFSGDARAATVLARAAEDLLVAERYRDAAAAARRLEDRQPAPAPALRKTAALVLGHAEFELAEYAAAEAAYHKVLNLIPQNDPARQDITERIAASVYKQGEQALARGDQIAAAEQFLRVRQVAPASAIGATAQYDAAANFLQARQWREAVAVLEDFRLRYPRHELVHEIPTRLVLAYQEQGEWAAAAKELRAIEQRSTDPEAKSTALYQAAEFYAKAGNHEAAIDAYRSYAHTYPEPLALAMEARYQLSELYLQTKEPDKRRFWLAQMIDAEQQAGAQSSERARYLAAFSSSVLAQEAYEGFTAIKLELPLRQSLQNKRKALDQALAALQQTANYGVQEFATKAAYQIGDLYAQLSADLLASERPKNLDELALEQYQILLEEQAFPFEEQAIEIHEANAQRSWNGIYDEWIAQSFAALAKLLPARYGKEEKALEIAREIY